MQKNIFFLTKALVHFSFKKQQKHYHELKLKLNISDVEIVISVFKINIC